MKEDDNESNEVKMYNMAKKGGLVNMDKALANKANPNWQNLDDYEKTTLHQAATYNNQEILRLHVAAGANINSQDEYGNTPLFYAACSVWGSNQGSLEAITTLIELGADTEIASEGGNTPVMVAKHSSTLEALIDAQANLRHKNDSGQTALHKFAKGDLFGVTLEDLLKMVGLLLQKGLDPMEQDNDGMTPIDYAKKQGYNEMVSMMMGGDVEITELDLFNAAEIGDVEYVNKALANKVNPNWVNLREKKRTALHQASQFNHSEVVRSLLAAGANTDLQDKDGETAIYLASNYGQIDTVTILLDYGADIEIANDEGLTPVMTAWRVEVMEALIAAHANLIKTDRSGRTALHLAIWSHKSEEAQLLMKKGIDARKQDNDGLTAADYAREYNQSELADIIDSFITSTASTNQPSFTNPIASSNAITSTLPTEQTSTNAPSTTATSTASTDQPSTTAHTDLASPSTEVTSTGSTDQLNSSASSTTAISTSPIDQLSTTAPTVPSTTASSAKKPITGTAATQNYDLLQYLLTCGIVLFIARVLYLTLY